MAEGPPTLGSERLVMRPFLESDAPMVQKLAGAPEVASSTLHIPHPYPPGSAIEWIGTHVGMWESGEALVLAITHPDEGLVGAVGLHLRRVHARAILGYWVGVPYWGRGYATEAARRVLDYAFDEMGLNRVEASHMTRNPASGRVMQKLGMQFEGIRREAVLKDGVPVDLAVYAVLAGDRGE